MRPRGPGYTRQRRTAISPADDPLPPPGLHLKVWHLKVAAAPHPCVVRADRLLDPTMPAEGVADVVRRVAVARQTLAGPLALEIDGPGDPLASPETVLRSLALLHEHHPDVMTGLVFDGPLLAEYVEELQEFGVRYLALRMDAVESRTQKRFVEYAVYRGDTLDRDEATRFVLEAGPQALRVAARNRIPVIVRLTLVPSVNAHEVEAVARRALEAGACRMHVIPHVPQAGTRLASAGAPTREELAEARATVADVFADVPATQGASAVLDWLAADRLVPVDTDLIDAVDVLRGVPAPRAEVTQARVLPPRRAQLVAVATRDGSFVDQPLEATHGLRIYAVTDRVLRCVGVRPLPLDPRRRQDGVGDAPSFLQAVVGCAAVVASRIPARAATLLEAVGIRAIAMPGAVEEVVDRVARGVFHQAGAQS